MIQNRRFTLEQRITRLENALCNNRRSARKFESGGDVAELRSMLDDWNEYDAPLHVTSDNGKIYVEYGPDSDDIYREFKLVPRARRWALMSDGYKIGDPSTMRQAFDMITDVIAEDNWDL
jgi:hypothetical protein